jgi:hypothetical protein
MDPQQNVHQNVRLVCMPGGCTAAAAAAAAAAGEGAQAVGAQAGLGRARHRQWESLSPP